jgi:protein pelota
MIYSIEDDSIRFSVEDEDDLYVVYLLLDKGDLLYGWTVREHRGRGEERGKRLKIYVGLRVEAMEYHAFRGNLRIRGVIVSAPEWFEGALGSHHTIELMKGLEYTIVKEKLNRDLVNRIMEAFARSSARVLLISVSDDELAAAIIRRFGTENLGTIRNRYGHRKDPEAMGLRRFIKESLGTIRSWIQSRSPTHVIIAGPHMVLELCRGELAEIEKAGVPVILHPQGSGGLGGLYEFQSSGVELLRELNVDVGQGAVEEIMRRLGMGGGDVALGLGSVERALGMGAVDTLVILDEEYKELGEEARRLVTLAVATRAGVTIVPSASNAGERLRGLGGVAALLRYPVESSP